RRIAGCPVRRAINRVATSGRRRRPSTRTRARPGRVKIGATAGRTTDFLDGRCLAAAVFTVQRRRQPPVGGDRAGGLAGYWAGARAGCEAPFCDVTRHLGLERTDLGRRGLEDDIGQEPDQQMHQRHRTTRSVGPRGPAPYFEGTDTSCQFDDEARTFLLRRRPRRRTGWAAADPFWAVARAAPTVI